jgi:hypothetical protein
MLAITGWKAGIRGLNGAGVVGLGFRIYIFASTSAAPKSRKDIPNMKDKNTFFIIL